MKTITITNLKGGVGKTTTAQALIECLRNDKKKVLAIDLDNQANLTYSMGFKGTEDIYSVLTSRNNINETINSDNIKSSKTPFNENTINDLFILKDQLKTISNNYDYCIIDTPPNLSKITTIALLSSDYVLIPTNADIYSIDAVERVIYTIKELNNGTNSISILGILITQYQERQQVSRYIRNNLEKIASKNDTQVFQITISKSVKIVENELLRKPITRDYSKPSIQYQELTKKILELLEKGKWLYGVK